MFELDLGRFGGIGTHRSRGQFRGRADVTRQSQPERGAEILAGTLDADGAAVEFDQVSHDRHAESKAAVTTAHRTVGLPETIEHEWQELRRDADAAVPHFNLRVAVLVVKRNLNASTLGRELQRVRDEV